MSVITTFTVNNKLSVNTTNHVLVFLKPIKASTNYQYFAWKDLNPAMNGSQQFNYEIDLGVQISDSASGNPPGPTSPIYAINPGQLFAATNPNSQGPILATTNINQGTIASSQAGVLNMCSTPTTSLSITWTNKGQPVVVVGAAPNDIVNYGKTVTLELEPTLYFMAADPTLVGTDFTLQDYSAMTPYQLTAGTTSVTIDWTRSNNGLGADVFTAA
ncbi:hypothetical protein [Variovorax terrae]|uniref:Uncharacterized protein n=1 Tax=Variovorax terrae TaxID=2923278 RepID=A0A9X2AKP7_9BURK|nr:hypothetical protein [Variovorax terrae]MCJ0761733.1 hypothetical protein [Variovorax terrae]